MEIKNKRIIIINYNNNNNDKSIHFEKNLHSLVLVLENNKHIHSFTLQKSFLYNLLLFVSNYSLCIQEISCYWDLVHLITWKNCIFYRNIYIIWIKCNVIFFIIFVIFLKRFCIIFKIRSFLYYSNDSFHIILIFSKSEKNNKI